MPPVLFDRGCSLGKDKGHAGQAGVDELLLRADICGWVQGLAEHAGLGEVLLTSKAISLNWKWDVVSSPRPELLGVLLARWVSPGLNMEFRGLLLYSGRSMVAWSCVCVPSGLSYAGGVWRGLAKSLLLHQRQARFPTLAGCTCVCVCVM